MISAAAAASGAGGMDGPIVEGLVCFGPHFLRRFEERVLAGEPLQEPFLRAGNGGLRDAGWSLT